MKIRGIAGTPEEAKRYKSERPYPSNLLIGEKVKAIPKYGKGYTKIPKKVAQED